MSSFLPPSALTASGAAKPTEPALSRRRGARASRERAVIADLATEQGAPVLLEPSHALPLVDLEMVLRTGSVEDPVQREGLMRIVGRMLRMGTRRLDGPTVEERIASLGARLAIETSTSYVRIQGTVIKRNLGAFVELVAQLVREPAFRAVDLAHVKRKAISDIQEARDSDGALAGRGFRQHLFGSHRYGRMVGGSEASIRRIQRADLVEHFRTHFVASNMIFGFSGDIGAAETDALVRSHLSSFRVGKVKRITVREPKIKRGRRVLIIDKPDRTQTQLLIGTLGAKIGDPLIAPLLVANTAFGGTFTARLMNEVRSKRGWSYGAYSRLGQDRQRDVWYMGTAPATKDAVACAALELDLLDALVTRGITKTEHRFARSHLVKSHCFDVDTAHKRLDQTMDEELYGLPRGYHDRFVERIRAVKVDDANSAVKERIRPDDLSIVLVATARDVEKDIAKLPGISDVSVVSFDQE